MKIGGNAQGMARRDAYSQDANQHKSSMHLDRDRSSPSELLLQLQAAAAAAGRVVPMFPEELV